VASGTLTIYHIRNKTALRLHLLWSLKVYSLAAKFFLTKVICSIRIC